MGFAAGEWLEDALRKGMIDPAQMVAPSKPADPLPAAPAPSARKPAAVRTEKPARLVVEFDLPVRAASEANLGGRRRASIGRKKAVKALTAEHLPFAGPMPTPCRVTITRHGVKRLDTDNLRSSLKAVRDVVAGWIGVDDGDEGAAGRVRWRYRQVAAWVPFVRVRFEFVARVI